MLCFVVLRWLLAGVSGLSGVSGEAGIAGDLWVVAGALRVG